MSVVEETVRDIRRANARYTATDQSIESGVPHAFDAEATINRNTTNESCAMDARAVLL